MKHKSSILLTASQDHFSTQVIQAPLSEPKAICHAGSSDWKYSSGWKKVLILKAFKIRNAIRNRSRSREIDKCLTRSTARPPRTFTSSKHMDLSKSQLVEACDIDGVHSDDMKDFQMLWSEPVHAKREASAKRRQRTPTIIHQSSFSPQFRSHPHPTNAHPAPLPAL